jgi:hypothetical protein
MDEATFQATVKSLKFHKEVSKIEVSDGTVAAHWVNDKNETEKSYSAVLSPETQGLDPNSPAFAEAAAKDFVAARAEGRAEGEREGQGRRQRHG